MVKDAIYSPLYIKKSEVGVKNNRNNFVVCLIGHNRTGKTTTAIDIALKYKRSRPNNIIYAYDPQHKFDNIADIRHYGPHQSKDAAESILALRNALVILDDYHTLHTKKTPEDWLSMLMVMREEWNVDIIYVTHSPSLVLNYLAIYTTRYYIYYTLATSGTFDKKIPSYEYLTGAKNYINKYVRKHGKGDYPRFPYVLVDLQNETLTAVNFNK